MEKLGKGRVFVHAEPVHRGLRTPALRVEDYDGKEGELRLKAAFTDADINASPIVCWSSWVELAHAILEKDFQLKLEEAA